MVGLNSMGVLGLGTLVLGVHLVSLALAKALRTYSPSRLADVCASRGHAPRADDVEDHDEAAELGAGGVATVTGLVVVGGLGAMAMSLAHDPPRSSVLVIIAALVSGLGSALAAAIGVVHAETVIDRLWPVSLPFRALSRPFGLSKRAIEGLVANLAVPGAGTPRPASVEVEITSDGDNAEETDADIPDSIRALCQQAVDLTRRDVSELMIPRPSIVSLPASISADAAARAFRETGRGRIPLFGENRDDIVGILYAKDLFPLMTDPDGPDAAVPLSLARPAHCIPETKNAYELLEEFRRERKQIAIVLDEYGSVAGLITLKDLLEELVGEIEDEHDVPSSGDPLVPLGGSRYEIDAALDLAQLNERLGLRLPTDGDYLTVGGLAFHTLGRVPEPGDSFRSSGVEFAVVEVVDHAIRRVRIDLQPHATVVSQ